MKKIIDRKQYYIINPNDLGILIVMSKNKFRALRKGRKYFGTTALHLCIKH